MFVFSDEQLRQLLQINEGWQGQNMLDLGCSKQFHILSEILYLIFFSQIKFAERARERERKSKRERESGFTR